MTTVFISLCISLLLNPASSRVCGLFFFWVRTISFINAICPSVFHRFVTGFRFLFYLEVFLYVLFFPFESCAFPFLFYVPLAEFGISFGLYHGLVLYYYDRSDGFLIFFFYFSVGESIRRASPYFLVLDLVMFRWGPNRAFTHSSLSFGCDGERFHVFV